MKILIVYGTTEGQTRKVAEFMADRIAALGHTPTLIDAVETGPQADPGPFDAAILAGSLHAGHYQAALVHFARAHHETLNAMPTAFVSVSLAAASDEPDDIAGLEKCIAAFRRETRWTPKRTEHVAGAFRFTQYDFLKRWALKYIAYRKGQPTDTSRDYELTDWDALGAFVTDFARAP